MARRSISLEKGPEPVVLAALDRPGIVLEEDLDELRELVRTAGGETVDVLVQKRDRPSPAWYMGSGKIKELAAMVLASGADLVVFNDELTPVQQRNITEEVKCRVLDRTQLILDIFAQRARTSEGKLQVELAQLTYLLPRLSSQYTQFERQAGGIGLRGPGETKLEADRRRVRQRISELKKQIDDVRRRRGVQRASRRKDVTATATLVGYTSAGKSTLLNALTGADVYADPKLFATLDPTTRRVRLPGGEILLLTDTVGFIRRLPHGLVAAFRATLEETVEADVLLHVVDASHPEMEQQIEAVMQVLDELHIREKPIVTVLNKIDVVPDTSHLRQIVADQPLTVYVSALTGDGLPQLLETVELALVAVERFTKIEAAAAEDREREQLRALRTL